MTDTKPIAEPPMMKTTTRMTRLERRHRNLRMYRDFASGASLTDVAEKYGCSPESVRARFRNLGLSLAEQNKQLTMQMHAEHCGGATIADIAEKYGYSPESVRRKFSYLGFSAAEQNKQLTMQMHAEHCGGATIADIAEKYGYSPQAVAGRFRRLGLPAMRKPRRSIDPKSGPPVTCQREARAGMEGAVMSRREPN